MDSAIKTSKEMLRQQVLARVKALTPRQRDTASAQARELLAAQPAWRQARSVFFYAPLPGELDVWPLLAEALAQGKIVGLPRFEARTGQYLACRVEDGVLDVQAGHYGIREPVERSALLPLNALDLVLVPGVAFDVHGCRLGRGKGFYDQFLAAVCGKKCGAAFDEQLVSAVPAEPHDVGLNCILTPSRWIECSSARGPE